MTGASEPEIVSTRQQRIAELALQAPQMSLTSLNHYLDLRWLYEAYQRTRPDGATGVDGQTAADFSQDLRSNLQALLEQAKGKKKGSGLIFANGFRFVAGLGACNLPGVFLRGGREKQT